MTPPTIRAEMAAAIRRLNVRYRELPPDAQDRAAAAWEGVDADLEAALDGDRAAALAAVELWEERHHVLFEEAR